MYNKEVPFFLYHASFKNMRLSSCPRIIWCLLLIPNIYLIERERESVGYLLNFFGGFFAPILFMISRIIWQIFSTKERKN